MSRQYIRWKDISWIHNLPDDFVLKYKRKLHFDSVLMESHLKEETLEKLSPLFTSKDWYNVWDEQEVSEEFIERHIDNVDWERVSCCQNLSEDFIRKYADKVDWEDISLSQEMSEQFVREFWDKIHKNIFFNFNKKVSNDFIREMRSKYPAEVIEIGDNCSVDPNIFREFLNELKWAETGAAVELTEEQIIEWRDYLDWHNVIEFQPKISQDFVKKFLRKVKDSKKWEWAFEYKKFDEEFIEEFMSTTTHKNDNKLWDVIWHSQTHQLSEAFIRRHIDKLSERGWKSISHSSNLSVEFYKEFAENIDWYHMCCTHMSDEMIEECGRYVRWDQVDYCERSIDFILKHFDKLNKFDLWDSFNYVKYILGYEDGTKETGN